MSVEARPTPVNPIANAPKAANRIEAELLLRLTQAHTPTARVSRTAAALVHYFLQFEPGPASSRRMAGALGLTRAEVRTALTSLLRCGWIVRQPTASRAVAHYSLTTAFFEALRTAEVTLDPALEAYPPHGIQGDGHGAVTQLPEELLQASFTDLMHRLFQLNEGLRRYGRGYRKTMIHSAARLLHWFIQADARVGGSPIAVSIRGLARDTRLMKPSAKGALMRLITWGLLAGEAGSYRVDRTRLRQLFYDPEAALPSPPRVLPK